MTDRNAAFGMFSLERIYPHAPAKVFRAFADPDAKTAWFANSDQWTRLEREMDFRVGGRELLSGRWPNGMVSSFDCTYLDIVPDERIVFSYVMHLDDVMISLSLTTIEFKPAPTGTRLVFTEQDVFVDGFEDKGGREHGSGDLLDRLAKGLDAMTAPA